MIAKATSWMLIIGCLLLGVLLVLPYQQDNLMDQSHNVKQSTEGGGQQINPYKQYFPAKIEQYLAMTDNPLFNSDRQPFIKVDKTPVKNTAVAKIADEVVPIEAMINLPRLIGVMTVDDIKMAFLLDNDDSSVISLTLGDKYKDWTLTTIDATQIMMTYNGIKEVITMDWLGREILQASSQAQSTQILEHRKRTEEPPQSLKDKLAKQLQGHR